jgi:hypothetical protein
MMAVMAQAGFAQDKVYKVGDTGPAGGIICYADGTFCLEAAPADTEFKAAWEEAKSRCAALTVNGVNGWRLPTKTELNLMYFYLKKNGLGGFSDGYYWSSSESDSTNAWGQRFSDGYQYNGLNYFYTKTDTYSVRAVRAF